MADYQIVCVERLAGHEHITHVGTGTPERANRRWTVARVRAAIAAGDTFCTVSPTTTMIALVEPYDVELDGELIETLRSDPDALPDNNLDSLRTCRFPGP